jgi:hypothetical protein
MAGKTDAVPAPVPMIWQEKSVVVLPAADGLVSVFPAAKARSFKVSGKTGKLRHKTWISRE